MHASIIRLAERSVVRPRSKMMRWSSGSSMRVATYSRYSSDLQDPRSITDQQRLLHDFA